MTFSKQNLITNWNDNKHDSNSNYSSYKFILENCSRNFMISTAGYYKKLLPPFKVQFDRIKMETNGKKTMIKWTCR